MAKKKFYVYEHPYVYIVLELPVGGTNVKIHGDVYTTKEAAEGMKAKAAERGAIGYLAILKKHISGISPRTIQTKYDTHCRIFILED